MSECPVCGTSMIHFTNPEREMCPDEGSRWHGQADKSKEISDNRIEKSGGNKNPATKRFEKGHPGGKKGRKEHGGRDGGKKGKDKK